jgi:hypothetical protein
LPESVEGECPENDQATEQNICRCHDLEWDGSVFFHGSRSMLSSIDTASGARAQEEVKNRKGC